MSGLGHLCGPECRYRQMYEGSQQSLSDMAARQAQAVDRLGRLRAAVVVALKRRFPRMVLAAESALGSRLSSLDDEELVAQLDALLATTRGSGVGELRSVLEVAGFVLPDTDELGVWARSLTQQLEVRAVAPSGSDGSELSLLFSGDDLLQLFASPVPEAQSAVVNQQTDGPDEVPAVVDAGLPLVAPTAASAVEGPLSAGQTLRPESSNTASGKGRRGRKVTAVAARPLPLEAPSASSVAAPSGGAQGGMQGGTGSEPAVTSAADDGDLLDLWVPPKMSQALLAGVCIPRPVFAADLVATAGSMERVQQWEEQCRQENAPVRIVPAKMRHARRGSLIFPAGEARDLAGAFGRSVWGDVLASRSRSYRGSRLYELAVLLHRVAEQVVSHRLDPNTATFRLSQPGGLTGVVAFFGGDLDDATVRGELLDRVGELVGERLAGVAVLTTNGDANVFERLIDTIAEAGVANGWKPTMPVVAAYSWEYADTRGSSVKLILGA